MISKSLGSSRKYHALLAAAGPLGEFCQVLFPLLVANSDDFGRFSGDAFTVKHAVLPTSPRPEAEFEQALAALAQVQLIQVYQVQARRYLQIADFQQHQQLRHPPIARFPSQFGPYPRGFPDTTGQFGPYPSLGPLRKEGRNQVSKKSRTRVRARGAMDEQTKAEHLARLQAWNAAHPEQLRKDAHAPADPPPSDPRAPGRAPGDRRPEDAHQTDDRPGRHR
jgi:hypothetical protein